VIEEVALVTEAVYESVALTKVGERVPDEIVNAESVASEERGASPKARIGRTRTTVVEFFIAA
jgi:hypothetical protein